MFDTCLLHACLSDAQRPCVDRCAYSEPPFDAPMGDLLQTCDIRGSLSVVAIPGHLPRSISGEPNFESPPPSLPFPTRWPRS
jgi:hypothetical protein